MTPAKLEVAREMYASRQHTIAAIAAVVGVSRATLYRALAVNTVAASTPAPAAPATAKEAPLITVAPAATAAPAEGPSPSPTETPRVVAARRRRLASTVKLPSAEAARARECPRCGAKPGVMCRDTRSKAKRKPAAEALTQLASGSTVAARPAAPRPGSRALPRAGS